MSESQMAFMNKIKEPCIRVARENKILPSIVTAIVLLASNWNRVYLTIKANNVFSTKVDPKWIGKCYEPNIDRIFKNKVLYRGTSDLYCYYDNIEDSIKEYFHNLLNKRRPNNGPYIYKSLNDNCNYKEFIDKLIRLGYVQESEKNKFRSKIITLIEEYDLYKLDSEVNNLEDKNGTQT